MESPTSAERYAEGQATRGAPNSPIAGRHPPRAHGYAGQDLPGAAGATEMTTGGSKASSVEAQAPSVSAARKARQRSARANLAASLEAAFRRIVELETALRIAWEAAGHPQELKDTGRRRLGKKGPRHAAAGDTEEPTGVEETRPAAVNTKDGDNDLVKQQADERCFENEEAVQQQEAERFAAALEEQEAILTPADGAELKEPPRRTDAGDKEQPQKAEEKKDGLEHAEQEATQATSAVAEEIAG